MTSPRPRSRRDFEIAILCALPVEADAVIALFDQSWEEEAEDIDKVAGDTNSYTAGAISNHNVVVAHMSGMGKVSAAGVAIGLRTSFPNIKLALVVGICGAVPRDQTTGRDIYLGDVIISQSLVEYDFGRQYPMGFEAKDVLEGGLGRPPAEIQSILSKLQTSHHQKRLQEATCNALQELHGRIPSAVYPESEVDRLFAPSHVHQHMNPDVCQVCGQSDRRTCLAAISATCDELGCVQASQVQRERSVHREPGDGHSFRPHIHLGKIGSGDTVMKSAEQRDEIASRYGIIAFEMEGAGVWNYFPSLVIKTVCDYADSHKNKQWQAYAAATAAACTKAFLQGWTVSREESHSYEGQLDYARPAMAPPTKHHFMVGVRREDNFIGQENVMSALTEKLGHENMHNRVALVALGGMGKTRAALELVLRLKNAPISVFWIHASNEGRVLDSYAKIAKAVNIMGYREDKSDSARLVKEWFESEASGRWLIVLDNADDYELFYGPRRLADIFPRSENGSIIMTTRDKRVGFSFTGAASKLIFLQKLGIQQARELLISKTGEVDDADLQDCKELCEELECTPLAIIQAAAYMQRNFCTAGEYLELYQQSPNDQIELLSEDFEDVIRDKEIKNPIATTWFISFEHIERTAPLAGELLKKMSLLDPHAVPISLILSKERPTDVLKAMGTLQSFSLITPHAAGSGRGNKADKSYDIHRLVHLAMRNWLKERNVSHIWTTITLKVVASNFPKVTESGWKEADRCRAYLPHATTLLCKNVLPESDAQVTVPFLPQKLAGRHVEDDGPCAICAADLMTKLSEVYNLMQGEDRGADWAAKALPLYTFVYGDQHPSVIWALIRCATAFYNAGQVQQAREFGEKAIGLMDTTSTVDPLLIAWKFHIIAYLCLEDNRIVESETYLQKALELRTPVLDPNNYTILLNLENLLSAYYEQSRYADVEDALRVLIERHTKAAGPSNPGVLRCKDILAFLYSTTGRAEEGRALSTEVAALRANTLGVSHPETLLTLDYAGVTKYRLGAYKEAAELTEQVLKLHIKIDGPESLQTLWAMRRLGFCYKKLGRLDEAEALFIKIKEYHLQRAHYHRDTIISMMDLAAFYEEFGQYRKAQPLREKVAEVATDKSSKYQPLSMCELGVNYEYQRLDKAVQYRYTTLRYSLETKEARLPVNIRRMADVARDLARMGKVVDAERIARDAVDLARQHGRPVPFVALSSLSSLAYVHARLNRPDEAEPLYREAIDILRSRREGEKDVPFFLTELASVLVQQARYQEAHDVCCEAKNSLATFESPEENDVLLNAIVLTAVYTYQGRLKDAQTLATATLEHLISKGARPQVSTIYSLSLVLRLVENVVRMYSQSGNQYETRKIYAMMLPVWQELQGSTDIQTLNFATLYVDILNQAGRYTEALEMGEKCARGYQELGTQDTYFGQITPATIDTEIARSYIGLGRWADAEPVARRAYETLKTLEEPGMERTHLLDCMSVLALVLREKEEGELGEAKALESQVLARWTSLVGENHAKTVEAMEALAVTCQRAGETSEADSLREKARGIKDSLDIGLEGEDLDKLGDLVTQLFRLWDQTSLVHAVLEKGRIA